ncbi:MAG TPA: DnaD domain protein [Chloroflexi bacterium]|nr:DnaD domain protein [Chloroflexota bacterium]
MFPGFPPGKTPLTPIPEPFFTELLPAIDHLGELKLTLYVFWKLNRMEGRFRYLRRADIFADEALLEGMGETPEEAAAVLKESLALAVERGTLLEAELEFEGAQHTLYFVNTPKGRAALQAIRQGRWKFTGAQAAPVEVLPPRPTVYQLYEENIGPLTPLIADTLKEAEETYPADWIAEAIQLAVERNVRHWRYVDAILRRWEEEGRREREHRGDSEETGYDKYTSGPFGEYVEH